MGQSSVETKGLGPQESDRHTPLMYLFYFVVTATAVGWIIKLEGGRKEGGKGSGSPALSLSTLSSLPTNIFTIKIAQTVTKVPRKSEEAHLTAPTCE